MKKGATLPALVFCAAAFSGIGLGLHSLVSALTARAESETENITALRQSPKTPTAVRKRLMDLAVSIKPYQNRTDAVNEPEFSRETIDKIIEAYWSNPFFRQRGTAIYNDPDDTAPDFETDCTSQCVYIENSDKSGFRRYDFGSGEIISLRVEKRTLTLGYCRGEPLCENALFTLDGTYLVIDADGDLSEFEKTAYNCFDKSLSDYYDRIDDGD